MKRKFRFDFSPKTQPLSHQVEAIDYIESHEQIALFDEQGLGKTKVVIEALCNNMRDSVLDGAIVVCRKHLIGNWQDEIERHSHLRSIVLRGTAYAKGLRFMTFAHFYLVNYEATSSEIERLGALMSIRKTAIVLDESHIIKNPRTQSARALFALRERAKKRILITGTPVANRPQDIWAQFFFLDGGVLLGRSYEEFRKAYTPDLGSAQLQNNEEKFNDLRAVLNANSIRRTKGDVLHLPEKSYLNIPVILTGRQRAMYEELRDDLRLTLTSIEGNVEVDEASVFFKRLLRLVQIASNPRLVDKAYNEIPAKFARLDELVEEILDRKQKVIIWSSFVDNVRLLRRRYKGRGAQMISGETTMDDRRRVVRRFMQDTDSKILVANPAAAREGLTLTAANNAVYVDRNFNMVDYLQSQDRIHRISQGLPCTIYKLIARDTIDEYVDELLYKKQKLAGFVAGDEGTLESDRRFLTREQLLEIMG
jgi:SNF2 family DNA or RNA helicase